MRSRREQGPAKRLQALPSLEFSSFRIASREHCHSDVAQVQIIELPQEQPIGCATRRICGREQETRILRAVNVGNRVGTDVKQQSAVCLSSKKCVLEICWSQKQRRLACGLRSNCLLYTSPSPRDS